MYDKRTDRTQQERHIDALAAIAERKIREAQARGEFDNLPGEGKPLVIEDLSGVPEDLRMAYKVLKNAGCLPPELELSNEVESLRRMVLALEEGEERTCRMRELNYKLMKLDMLRRRPLNLERVPEYRERLVERLGSGTGDQCQTGAGDCSVGPREVD